MGIKKFSKKKAPRHSDGASTSPSLVANCAPRTLETIADWLFRQQDIHSVLDIPSGEGAFAAMCAERDLRVVAADVETRAEVDGVIFRSADMNAPLPFARDNFDAVVCIDGIEHIERPFDFIIEARRVLRSDGWLIISTPNISSLRSRWRWLWTGFHNKAKSPLNEGAPNPLHHINMRSFHELRYQLHRSGFQLEHITTNRVKLINWLYAPLAPMAYAATSWVMASEESDPEQKLRNREILAQLHSVPVLFGETLILCARKAHEMPAEQYIPAAA